MMEFAANPSRDTAAEAWIDLPIPADEPVKTALLRSFLTQHQVDFDESQRGISIRCADAETVRRSISIWAYHQDLPDDDRHLDTLASTLRSIGDAVLGVLDGPEGSSIAGGHAPPAIELDLR